MPEKVRDVKNKVLRSIGHSHVKLSWEDPDSGNLSNLKKINWSKMKDDEFKNIDWSLYIDDELSDGEKSKEEEEENEFSNGEHYRKNNKKDRVSNNEEEM